MLFLLISPNGGKWWRLKYRFDGKERKLSFGVYPDVSLKEARDRRDEARKLVANGIDPSESRKAKKLARAEAVGNSLGVITRDWFASRSRNWASNHSDRVIQLFENNIFPWLDTRPITDITSPEILAVVQRIEKRGALETAHRTLQNCGMVFRYAIASGRAKNDPTIALRGALAPYKGTHFAAATEPKDFAKTLRALHGYDGTPSVSCALRLAPLVFVRLGELRQAASAEIDLNTAEWRYTVTKTEHVVPLSRQAIEILHELKPFTGRGRFVFPSARSNTRPMSDNAILAAMRRMGIDKEEMSGHGFRAVARTILDEVLGFRPDIIEHQLVHTVRDPNGRAYNRTAHLVERKKMMQQWADYLDKLKAGAEVIPICQGAE